MTIPAPGLTLLAPDHDGALPMLKVIHTIDGRGRQTVAAGKIVRVTMARMTGPGRRIRLGRKEPPMHPNPIFRQTPADRNLGFARTRGFGALVLNGPGAPLVAHVPFVLSADGKSAELHLMRSNPIARAPGAPSPALLAVSGPDGYVSPDWYGVADQVPTWNYVAVHLRGTLHALEPGDLAGVLDRLSAAFEDRLAPKPAWLSAKMPAGTLARMMRAITAFRLDIAAVEGTWKLGQNKPAAARAGAADGLAAAAIGSETGALARLMRTVDSDPAAP